MKKIFTLLLVCCSIGLMGQSFETAVWYNRHGDGAWTPYKAVRIGEYLWIDQNFRHTFQYPNGWSYSTTSKAQLDKINTYWGIKPVDNSPYNLNSTPKVNDFNYFFGYYYKGWRPCMESWDVDRFQSNEGNSALDLMHTWGGMTLARNGAYINRTDFADESQDYLWGLPANADFEQLVGMCKFNGATEYLDSKAVRKALTSKLDATVIIPSADGLSELTIKHPLATSDVLKYPGTPLGKWFDGLNPENEFGFNLLPAGQKLFADNSWDDAAVNGGFVGVREDFFQPYTVAFPTRDGGFVLTPNSDNVMLYETIGSKLFSVRWCRKLTPDELGYEVFARRVPKVTGPIVDLRFKKKGTANWQTNTQADQNQGWEKYPLAHGLLRGLFVKNNVQEQLKLDKGDVTGKPIAAATIISWFNNRVKIENRTECGLSLRSAMDKSPVSEVTAVIYPNPVQDILNIKKNFGMEYIAISIFDFNTGKLMLKKTIDVSNQVDVSSLRTGIYAVRIDTKDGQVLTTRMMKK